MFFCRILIVPHTGAFAGAEVNNAPRFLISPQKKLREIFAFVDAPKLDSTDVQRAFEPAGDGTDDYTLAGLEFEKMGRRDGPTGEIEDWNGPLPLDPPPPDDAQGVFHPPAPKQEEGTNDAD